MKTVRIREGSGMEKSRIRDPPHWNYILGSGSGRENSGSGSANAMLHLRPCCGESLALAGAVPLSQLHDGGAEEQAAQPHPQHGQQGVGKLGVKLSCSLIGFTGNLLY
jgi:hypothetical protein